MMLSLSRPARSTISALLAGALLASTILSAAPLAFAGSAPPPPRRTASPPGSAPRVLRELEASRTAGSNTFAMSDGSRRTELFLAPIRYRDAKGAWRDTDPTLVPGGRLGELRPKSVALAETFGSGEGTAVPVTVTNGEWSLGMKLLGSRQGRPIGLGDEAVYPLVQTATQLRYRARADGIEDTLVLASREAPNEFTFHMPLKGLTLRAEPTAHGGYAVYDSRRGRAIGRIKPLRVFDSAAGGGAECDEASMSVVPAPGGVNLTYRLPRRWLDSPTRVFPVYVDPQIVLAGVGETRNDTYVVKGEDAPHASEDTLDTGQYTRGSLRRSLLSFDLSAIPRLSVVNSAKLQVYLSGSSSTKPFTSVCQPVMFPWGADATWSKTFGPYAALVGTGGDTHTFSAGADQYGDFDLTGVAQRWIDGRLTNYGLTLYDEDETCIAQHAFCSSEYTKYTSRRPHLIVDYTPPSLTAEPLPSTVRPGDEVSIEVRANESNARLIQARIMGTLPNGETTRTASFAYSKSALPSSWVATAVPGGYIGYQKTAAVTSMPQVVQPLLSECSVTSDSEGADLTFVYRVESGQGGLQDNRLSVVADWMSGWQDAATSYQAVTAPVKVSASATALPDWFDEAAGAEASATAGRGAVNLSWPADPFALGYRVYLYDGAWFRQVATTTATSWSTLGKKLYPSDSAIASLPADYAGGFPVSRGLDLRDDPRPLYAKTPGTLLDRSPAYSFKVVPFNDAGSAYADCRGVPVALPGRTKHRADAPRHTVVDLGKVAADDVRARADVGDLLLSATDLSIPGVGPDVEVSRAYRSSLAASTLAAPGWRFGFERSIVASGTSAVYCDEAGGEWTFRKVSGGWVAPHGSADILAGDSSSGFTLSRKDRSVIAFDASGRLAFETDAFGNAVRYEWSGDGSSLVIRSPKDVPFLHERRITVTFSAGKVVKAVAHVGGSDEDRVATYASAAGSFTVKRLAGTDAELTTQYGYDDAKRIRTVSVPGFTPSSDGAAHWSVSYPPAGGIVLANETGGGTPRAPLAVMPGGNAGTALVVSASGTSTLAFSPLGEQIASTAENTSVATFHDYDVEGFRIAEKTPLGRTTSAVYDERGNAIAETDESGGVTSRQFEGDLCTKETDARGAVTVRSYDAATGALLSEECTLNDEGDKSHVDYAYNGDGTLSRERKAITETLTAQTNYADYADCGNAQKTTQVGVEVAPGVIRDLVARASYDGFGDQLSVQDAEGVVVERNSYDPAGRLIESIDASDTVEHTRYGLLGEQCSRWESNPATSTRAAWVDTVSNAAGEPIVEVTRASNGTTVSAVTHRYDTAGREVATDDSTVPGAEVTKYDGQGNVAQVWDEGSNTSLSSASTRSEFNAEGEEIRSTQPGATTASTDTSYTADGAVARVSEAEAASVRCAYDESGDLSQQTVSTDAGDASTVMENDLVGRPVDEVDCDGTRETIEYDLDGNEVGRALGDEAESLTRVNTLGWTLVDVDADGALSRSSYDLDGRLVAETVGASSSQSRYDGCGRLSQQVGRDGIVADHAYDCFGSEVLRTETSGTILLKATATSYDGAHRIATETITDASGTTLRSYTYAPDGRQTVAESRRGGSIVTTSVSDGTDAAVCCSSTILGRSFSWSVSATDAAGRTTTLESTGLPSAQRSVWTQTGKPSSSRLGSATADYTYSAVSGRKSAESFHFAFGGRTESWSYGYDLAGRLSTATLNGVPTVYRYDPASGSLLSVKSGNATMTALSYEASGTDRLVSAGDGRYAFDDQGRRIAAQNDRYEWSGDTLAVVRTSRGTAAYTYDSQGQRTGSAVASGSLSTATRYEYDEDRLQSLTATRSDGATWSVDYAYDDGGVLLGGVYRTRSDALWFVAETTGRGDVRELMTSDGRAFAFYGYDAYGKPSATLTTATPSVSATVAADIAVRQPVRYGGYVFDAESGLYYCMARYYDPATAAFISKDPDRSDGQQSAFQYCSDDPIDAVDPTGCDVWGYGKYGDAFYRKTTSSSRSKKSKKAERTLVKYCRSRVGGRYVFGAKAKRGKEWRKGPLDCSGLTAAAYRVAHKVDKRTFRNIPDGSYNQHDSSRSLGFKRKASKLKIGDLGFLHYGGTKRGRVHHVGIYIGRSVVIEARGKKWGVVKTSLAAFNKRGADWHRARKH